MASLLHLDSSAKRSEESISRQLTAVFADTWRGRHPSGDYRYRDLAAAPVPPLKTADCSLGRRVERYALVPSAQLGDEVDDPAEREAWKLTYPLVAELLAADVVLIGAPMYNYSVPAALKAWIDRVSFPGAFVDAGRTVNLLRDTIVVVVSARGGAYGPGSAREAWDFETPYLRAYFGKLGIPEEHLHFVGAELTLADLMPHLAAFRPLAERSLAAARAELMALARAPVSGSAAPTVLPTTASRAVSYPDGDRGGRS